MSIVYVVKVGQMGFNLATLFQNKGHWLLTKNTKNIQISNI